METQEKVIKFPIIDKEQCQSRKGLIHLLSSFKEGESFILFNLTRKELLRLKGCMQAINMVKGERVLVMNSIQSGDETKYIVSKLWK